MNLVFRLLLRRLPLLTATILLLTLLANVRALGKVDYWFTLSQQYFPAAALALALTPIILTGGIDLSVGSLTVLSSIVVGVLWRDAGLSLQLAIVGGILAGLLGGLANGFMVSLGVLPLVATLATRELYRGLGRLLIDDHGVTNFPPWMSDYWHRDWLGLPLSLWALLVLMGFSAILVHRSWVGRAIYALGENATAARFAAVPVRGVQLGIYAWSGLIAGICGVTLLPQYGAAKADAEMTLELLAITCVVIGGVRVTGGSGNVGGVCLGIVTIVALQGGIDSIDASWRDTVLGAILLSVALVGEAGQRAATLLPGKLR